MSTTSKTIIGIVIAVVLIAGIWWYMGSQGMHTNAYPPTSTSTPAAAYGSPNQPVAANTSTSTSSLSQGSTNQDLDQDMTQINAQMNAYASESANVDQSFNDQPVSQGQ